VNSERTLGVPGEAEPQIEKPVSNREQQKGAYAVQADKLFRAAFAKVKPIFDALSPYYQQLLENF
jgi:hypothetical protein